MLRAGEAADEVRVQEEWLRTYRVPGLRERTVPGHCPAPLGA